MFNFFYLHSHCSVTQDFNSLPFGLGHCTVHFTNQNISSHLQIKVLFDILQMPQATLSNVAPVLPACPLQANTTSKGPPPRKHSSIECALVAQLDRASAF